MLARFRNGCLTTICRKDGIKRWLFRWRERFPDGTLRERNKVIGLVEEYPAKSKKLQEAIATLRLKINTDGPTELTSVTMTEAVKHYKINELADCGREGKAYSTRNRKTLVRETASLAEHSDAQICPTRALWRFSAIPTPALNELLFSFSTPEEGPVPRSGPLT